MCMCKQNHRNGMPGAYSWDGKSFSTRQADPPQNRRDDEVLVYDEPGRCARGLDSHCHHFQIVQDGMGKWSLLARNGSGDHRYPLQRMYAGIGNGDGIQTMIRQMPDEDRYWFLQWLYNTIGFIERGAVAEERKMWRRATIDKTVKVRRRSGQKHVEIHEPGRVLYV